MSEERKAVVFTVPVKLFELGQIVATQRAVAATTDEQRIAMLRRHLHGDWGIVGIEDRKTNFEALTNGDRIHSVYYIEEGEGSEQLTNNEIWIITEADRSATTFLMPDEY